MVEKGLCNIQIESIGRDVFDVDIMKKTDFLKAILLHFLYYNTLILLFTFQEESSPQQSKHYLQETRVRHAREWS